MKIQLLCEFSSKDEALRNIPLMIAALPDEGGEPVEKSEPRPVSTKSHKTPPKSEAVVTSEPTAVVEVVEVAKAEEPAKSDGDVLDYEARVTAALPILKQAAMREIIIAAGHLTDQGGPGSLKDPNLTPDKKLAILAGIEQALAAKNAEKSPDSGEPEQAKAPSEAEYLADIKRLMGAIGDKEVMKRAVVEAGFTTEDGKARNPLTSPTTPDQRVAILAAFRKFAAEKQAA